ncbi:tRNA (adenosine(37)-N6)-threonylcarbamoyltransferase complex dimerization subunit type 1 TsaB [Sabulicella glaciei]|uniref:tRNA (Adenosine(37)-N6)-threonylcarbamoyltransferase complex dimerization subunit type 1 TsaB n=1 Tax=Sabulicella glaciei TaxID=2984948 RepID=A0ABT3P042_9PROT|nr:tRNA (adenosine(37)-N6)-threonylcarbamoyltransferase complex dimerization subunit type 1 TsaB [Roseococcus sp. MDT2-1-1]MCW8087777.1 tRNA (adenosine(37)-N6)-threonylcarbamoyltransferase complex dimerization subunit type 1 TsaB [Roseococcus sp. MDT2-1-1]
MRLLLLDAAGDRCLAALCDGETLLTERSLAGRHGQPAALPPLVEAVLEEAGMPEAVAVCVGPGSFTGIRAALALAEGLALARNLPLCGVSAGEAMAAECGPGWPVWSATDNRRGALFLEGPGEAVALAETALPMPEGPVRLAGDAAPRAAARLLARGARVLLTPVRRPGAPGLARVALRRLRGDVAPRMAEPLYVEPPATT